MKIAVIDGQGGGIGAYITKRIREELSEQIEIIALGTNAIATSAMMKAKANKGASGENAIITNVGKVKYIIGPLAIMIPNAMLGELTPKMAEAIALNTAQKIILPLSLEGIELVGYQSEPLPHLVDKLISILRKEMNV